MPHRFNGDFSRLESKERKDILPVNRILQEMRIQKGDTVIDFGCGIGYLSIPALDFVGEEGTVIGIDVSWKMLHERSKRAGHRKNLQLLQTDSLDGLKAEVVLLSMVLHEVEDPKMFLRSCFTVVHPHGRVIVIDWQKDQTGEMGPPVEERLAKEEVIRLAQRRFLEHPLHAWVYFLEFFSE